MGLQAMGGACRQSDECHRHLCFSSLLLCVKMTQFKHGAWSAGGAGVPGSYPCHRDILDFHCVLRSSSDGRVRVWGSTGDGGVQPSNLDVVSSVSSTYRAFAALTEHGTVVAWGNPRYGGGMTDVTIDGVLYTGVPAGMTNVRALYSTIGAFAA